ncbi:unnamed protein product [Caenorhabditis bovis]|uniref:Uncharacterized protein n=1 Tax=Caenorhabditis bovis TaxID=2654633 RepID=A0A8S1EEW7_9PELO|nr:unnamed protein product [Caenorhabditis bovis]
MKAIGEYFSDLMGCGEEGWCAFRCCPSVRQNAHRRYFPNPATSPYNVKPMNPRPMSRYPYVNRNPTIMTTTTLAPMKQCANACMPGCTSRCLKRYNQIVTSFMNSLTAIDVMGQPVQSPAHNIRFSPKKSVQCRDECMPYCTPQCVDTYAFIAQKTDPKVCKAACMPDCLDDCVNSPPLMVPCVFDGVCHCPAGYVRCSEMTCCMKYKTMAIKYKNRLTSMSFSDNDEAENEDDADTAIPAGNETMVYVDRLRKMGSAKGGTKKRSLPATSKIIYYPEQGKAELVNDDGTIIMEVVENAIVD